MTVEQFDEHFAELRPSLVSFLFRMTTNREDAEDCAQEAYLKARRGLGGFEGRSSPKTWVFQIATNLVRDRKRARARWREDTQDRCKVTRISCGSWPRSRSRNEVGRTSGSTGRSCWVAQSTATRTAGSPTMT